MFDKKEVRTPASAVSPQLKVILLRMFRELYKKAEEKGKPLSSFGTNEMQAEAALMELIDSLSREQMATVLKVGYALGMALFDDKKLKDRLIGSKGSSERAMAWIESWVAKNAPMVKWKKELDTLVMAILLASFSTVESPEALMDIMGEHEFVKMMAKQNAAKAEKAEVEKVTN